MHYKKLLNNFLVTTSQWEELLINLVRPYKKMTAVDWSVSKSRSSSWSHQLCSDMLPSAAFCTSRTIIKIIQTQ